MTLAWFCTYCNRCSGYLSADEARADGVTLVPPKEGLRKKLVNQKMTVMRTC